MQSGMRISLPVAVAIVLLIAMPVFSLSTTVQVASATAPPPCVYNTEQPHETQGVIRLHAVTDCTNRQGVGSMYMETTLYDNQVLPVGSNTASRINAGWLRTTVNHTCVAGNFFGATHHYVTYNGNYTFKYSDGAVRYISPPC